MTVPYLIGDLMRVRIVNRPTGLINGVEWPPAGEEIDLPQSTAEDMAASGTVEIVVEKRPSKTKVETRKKAETA